MTHETTDADIGNKADMDVASGVSSKAMRITNAGAGPSVRHRVWDETRAAVRITTSPMFRFIVKDEIANYIRQQTPK